MFYKDDVFEVTPQAMIKEYWTVDYKNKHYEIVIHKGLKYSVFKDSKQIAYFIKQAVTFGTARNILIELNNDEDIELICTFAFALCCDFEETSDININLGLTLGEYKKFDNKWKAKI